MIRRPREIYLQNGGATLESIEILDADGDKRIIKLKNELMLHLRINDITRRLPCRGWIARSEPA